MKSTINKLLLLVILALFTLGSVIAEDVVTDNVSVTTTETPVVTTETAPSAAPASVLLTSLPSTGSIPLVVTFTANSTVPLVSSSWDFNGDGEIDSTKQNPPPYPYTQEGVYTVKFTGTTETNEVVESTVTITVKTAMSATIIANPLSGPAPLKVQFNIVESTGKAPLTYAWDFNNDGSIESIKQSTGFTYEDIGEYNATLTIIDASGNKLEKIYPITVSNFDSKLKLDAYSPKTLNYGPNEITLTLLNEGTQTQKDISAKIVGNGVQHLSSSTLDAIKPGDQDYLTVKMNILEAKNGMIDFKIKVLDKVFPVSFSVNKPIEYNKDELQTQLNQLKNQEQLIEKDYNQKKLAGYLVSELSSKVQSNNDKLEAAQQQILSGKLAEAKITLDLTASALQDTNTSLTNAVKEEKSFLQWLSENLSLVVGLITGLATIGTAIGFLVKHFKTAGEKVKEKITAKKEEPKKEEHKKEHHHEKK